MPRQPKGVREYKGAATIDQIILPMAPRALDDGGEEAISSSLLKSAAYKQTVVADLVDEDNVDQQRNDEDAYVGKIEDEDRRKSPSPTNERRLSNLFNDEDSFPGSSGHANCDPGGFPSLALMPSSGDSPMSTISLTPRSKYDSDDLDEARAGGLFGFHAEYSLQCQLDADEALARQLQEEEDKKRSKFSNSRRGKSKPRLVGTDFFASLGAPSPMELQQMQRVQKSAAKSPSDDTSITSMLSRWGGCVMEAANDFLRDERPPSRFSKGGDNNRNSDR